MLRQELGTDEAQILLVDDASPDFDPRRFLDEIGATRIACIQHGTRLGLAGNWNACISMATGQWIHLLHQDDLVLPGFYKRLREGIETEPSVGAAYCRDMTIDARNEPIRQQRKEMERPGILGDWLEPFFIGLRVRASAIAVKRSVYEALGQFDPELDYALDWDMWKRVAAHYPVWYEPETLAHCRIHDRSATNSFLRSSRNIKDIRLSIERSISYLPENIALETAMRARRNYTEYAIRLAGVRLLKGDVRSAVAHFREAGKLVSNAAAYGTTLRLLARKIVPVR